MPKQRYASWLISLYFQDWVGVQCTLLYRKAQYLLVLNYREQFGLDAMVAEIKITKPVLCLALRKAPPNPAAMLNKPGMKLTAGKFGNRPRDFTYDVSKADEIYDCLEKVGSPEHQVQLDTLKGQNPVCKFHASNSHATADCVAFCHAIQDKRRLAEVSRKGKTDVDWQATISQDRASSAGVYSLPLRRKPRIRRWTYGYTVDF